MYGEVKASLAAELREIRESGLYKEERVLAGSQQARVTLDDGRQVINMCANNYLGLASHPAVIEAARSSFETWGYGLSSVRFICGTQAIHKQLEAAISAFLGTEETILYASCFDANGGLFETLLGKQDGVFSDALNHASIIDGIRLCKAQRFRFAHNDMADLEAQLAAGSGARRKLIATDGVFSMDGTIADLSGICDLADRHGAMVMIDDCHAVGFLGAGGRGTPEYRGVMERVDVITGTLGKALGGASGGYTSGRREIIAMLRQRSRPYLFSNTVAPAIVAASLKVLELLSASTALRDRLWENRDYFAGRMRERGFAVPEGEGHPIIPIMLGEATAAQEMAARLLERGVYAIGFFYPVVPQGTARIRTQISAAHTREDLDAAVDAFVTVRDAMGLSGVGRGGAPDECF